MRKITVGAEQHPTELAVCLQQAGKRLEQQGVALYGEQFTRGKYTFYTYRLADASEYEADEFYGKALQAVAEAVADYVTQVVERHELQRIVTSDFYYYASDEVEYLADSAVQMLSEVRDEQGRPLRHAHIVEQVLLQLQSGQELLIEGFLRFRLKGLEEDLHRVVEQAIDEYLLDLEYQEFVKLLRYFLEVQEPGLPLMHLVCVDERTTRLFDQEGRPIEVQDVEVEVRTPQGMQELDLPMEDLLSVLIAMAPGRLQIHLAKGMAQEPPVVETVKKIFLEKATVCSGCPLCEAAEQWQACTHLSQQNRP